MKANIKQILQQQNPALPKANANLVAPYALGLKTETTGSNTHSKFSANGLPYLASLIQSPCRIEIHH